MIKSSYDAYGRPLFESKRTGISLINPQNNPYRRNEFEHEAHMKDDVG